MEQKFLLIGLVEKSLIDSVRLGSTGLETGEEYFILGKHVNTFDTYGEAYDAAMKEADDYEHGFEIKSILVRKN